MNNNNPNFETLPLFYFVFKHYVFQTNDLTVFANIERKIVQSKNQECVKVIFSDDLNISDVLY